MSEENELPKGWVWTTLENIAEIRDELRLPISSNERIGRAGPYPYYGATGQVGWIDAYLMDGEYVLLGEDGAPFLDPFKPKAYIVTGKCWVNNHAHVLQVIEGLGNNKFLLYALNAVDYREIVSGTTRPKLTQSSMRQISIRVPPLSEQKRIVDAIEEHFSRLDAIGASLQQDLVKLKQSREAILKSAVEGELSGEWRAEHPTSESGAELLERIQAERRVRWEAQQLAKMEAEGMIIWDDKWKDDYIEPLAPDTMDLPELPEDWCWATFEQISERVTVGYVGSMRNEYVEEGIPFLRSQNVRPNRFDPVGLKFISPEFHRLLAKSALEPGDILVVRSGSVGTACVMPVIYKEANCADLVIVKRPILVNPYYVAYYMNSTAQALVRIKQVGMALTHFNTQSMATMPLPLPPLDEQEQIVAEVEHRLSAMSYLESTIEASLKRLEDTRQSILKEALAGRLVPQDPNDEPASELLEHIREERERRAQEEQQRRRGTHMDILPNIRTKKTSRELIALWKVLSQAGRSLTPHELFRQAGLDADNIEHVDRFYDELRAEVDKRIKVLRPDNTHILLEAISE